MSTRCQIMFHWGQDETAVAAILYRHSDGYPDTEHGVLADLDSFFDDLDENLADKRYNDPCYLAAKLLVWFVSCYQDRYLDIYKEMARDAKDGDDYASSKLKEFGHPCDFLGHGIDMRLHGDIEYLYHIHCNGGWGDVGRPKVTWEHVTDEVQKRYAHLVKAAQKKVKIPAGVINEGTPTEAQ